MLIDEKETGVHFQSPAFLRVDDSAGVLLLVVPVCAEDTGQATLDRQGRSRALHPQLPGGQPWAAIRVGGDTPPPGLLLPLIIVRVLSLVFSFFVLRPSPPIDLLIAL